MPLHDLGYRALESGRLSSFYLRWLVIAQTGIRLIWKNSWLRRMLVFAWLPTIPFGFAFFAYEQSLKTPSFERAVSGFVRFLPQSDPAASQMEIDPAEARHEVWSLLLMAFFRYPQGVLVVLLVGLIAPSLIAHDVRSRAFLLYFSRPITVAEYVLGKSMIVWCYLALVTTVPALGLYVLGVALSPGLEVVADTWDLPLRILASSVVLLVPTTALALFLSSMTSESRYAGFAWFAIWILGWVAYANLATVVGDQWSMLSLYHMLEKVQTWVFGLSYNVQDVSAAATLLIVLTVASVVVLLQRVGAPTRI